VPATGCDVEDTAPPTATGVNPEGATAAFGASAQAWPDAAEAAAVSVTPTVERDVMSTVELFAPPTSTPLNVVLSTVFWATNPVALALPDAAVVTPVGTAVPAPTVGAIATLFPVPALAALESVTLLVC